jgi:hypothetical protein
MSRALNDINNNVNNLDLNNCQIFYFDSQKKSFIFIGIYPLLNQ